MASCVLNATPGNEMPLVLPEARLALWHMAGIQSYGISRLVRGDVHEQNEKL